jgi:adenine-specific DNA-methyltransferase
VPTTATLVPDVEASLDWENATDVLVEGDNLQVLKVLSAGYAGAAKLIYIDPPYNTGETFTYNDAFAVPESEYLTQTGQLDAQGNAVTSRIETAGRKHAPWLTMMFPRLAVARHLLRRDGVVLVSIDNNEVHHLRLLLDAIFGADNFVDMMTWRGARKGDGKLTAGGQDYILVYARDRAFLKANDTRWRERKTGLEEIYAKVDELRTLHGNDYEAATSDLKDWFKSLRDDHPSKEHDYYDRIDDKGVWFSDNISSPNYRENLVYEWKGYQPPANGWRYEKPTMQRLHDEGRLIYPEDKSKRVQIKSYLHMLGSARDTPAPDESARGGFVVSAARRYLKKMGDPCRTPRPAPMSPAAYAIAQARVGVCTDIVLNGCFLESDPYLNWVVNARGGNAVHGGGGGA